MTASGAARAARPPGDARAALRSLAEAYWTERLSDRPLEATAFGVRTHDHLLPAPGAAARAAQRGRLAALREELRSVDATALADEDRLTAGALAAQLDGELDLLAADLEPWAVDPQDGTPVALLNIEAYQPLETPQDGRAMAARWRAIGPYVDGQIEDLRAALGRGCLPVRDPVARVIAQLDDLAGRPDDEWAFVDPARVERPSWSPADAAALLDDLRDAVGRVIRPAFGRYRALLADEVLPRARPSERPGIMHVPGGQEAYARLIRFHTSRELTAGTIHELGRAEVERIDGEIRALGRQALGATSLEETLARLRGDPALFFSSREEVAGKALLSVTRAQEAIPRWFGVLPRADCVVIPMGAHEERHSAIAYYRDPDPTGRRPGQFYINTSQPHTRARFEAEALAFHEAIPGHHLQVAIGQEIPGLPEFRRHLGVTAFWEGWGLYAERLADEMGLYSGDLDRLGMLSADAWRACRLVVDTGMHALGWTRSQAIEYLTAHSAVAEDDVVNEVDRYIVAPGQALAYKIGQLELLRMRERAERALGPAFDIRAFHDALLAHGALPLGLLDEVVDAHIASRAAGAPVTGGAPAPDGAHVRT